MNWLLGIAGAYALTIVVALWVGRRISQMPRLPTPRPNREDTDYEECA
jgi:hypothetical protein